MFFAILRCVKHLNKDVKAKFIKELQRYDELIDEKSKQLQDLQDRIDREEMVESPASVIVKQEYLTSTFLPQHAEYENDQFFHQYDNVQQMKVLAREAATAKIEELGAFAQDEAYQAYHEVEQMFTNDIKYQLMTLREQDLLDVLAKLAQSSTVFKKILKQYSDRCETFDFMQLMNEVHEACASHDTTIYVYTKDKSTMEPSENVVFIEDDNIAEGYKIKYKAQVFDYSL